MPISSRPKDNFTSAKRAALLAEYAATNRAAPTRSEERLWRALRASQLGTRFRRQVVLGDHIVDFYAPAARLVVEVDGEYHALRQRADARRDARLARAGYRVLHVEARAVIEALPLVLRKIEQRLGLSRAPST